MYINLFGERDEPPTNHLAETDNGTEEVYTCPVTGDLFATLTEEKQEKEENE